MNSSDKYARKFPVVRFMFYKLPQRTILGTIKSIGCFVKQRKMLVWECMSEGAVNKIQRIRH